MKILKGTYIENRFFYGLLLLVMMFLISYALDFVFIVAQICTLCFAMLVILDGFLLFGRNTSIKAFRLFNPQMSLSDTNTVKVQVDNQSAFNFRIELIDELPVQFQERNFSRKFQLSSGSKQIETYDLRPVKRGEYVFGLINLYLKSTLGILSRRLAVETKDVAKVYPSIVQMKKYELQIQSKTASFHGIKKIRRLGNNNEFEQIKQYVAGDDFRAINWKATSRSNSLMVNQYQDEKSQQVYCIIDKSRAMRMPFNGMSLLDYAINSTLTISNISMIKGDKSGVITFSDKLGSRLKAERSSTHLKRIMDVLYRQKTRFNEANYELLYYGVRQNIKGRSLVLLYTNFESKYALQRALPVLRKLNQMHLLVVVFFVNTEIQELTEMPSETVKEIYFKTMAEKFTMEKSLIVRELSKYGIQAILSKPEELSINTINKYLELKSRGMI